MRSTMVVLVAMAGQAWAAPTDTLDLEVDQHGSSYVLHDAAYAITFPNKPQVHPLTFKYLTDDFPAASATALHETAAYTITIKPMPKRWTGPSRGLLDELRDGFVKGRKLTAETPITLAGLAGRHLSIVNQVEDTTLYSETDILWDGEHRVAISVITIESAPKRSADAQAFAASLQVRHDTRGPTDPPELAEGVATKAGILDFDITRHGSTYLVRDATAQVTFPSRPTFHTQMTTPFTIAGADWMGQEIETLGFVVAVIPADLDFDASNLADGMVAEIRKNWKDEHHKEAKAKVGGLPGTRMTITGTQDGVPARGEVRVLWRAKQRQLFMMVAVTSAKKLSPAATTFLDSFAIAKK